MESGNGFDQWLEQQLHNEAARASGPSPTPTQAQYHAAYLQGGLHMSGLGKAAALVSAKGAAGLAIALLAVGAAGVVTEAAVTGSANPANWGQAVVNQVNQCKHALTPGEHGIGQCVSAFAKTHGEQVSSQHASGPRTHEASDARKHTPGPTDGHGRPSSVPPTR